MGDRLEDCRADNLKRIGSVIRTKRKRAGISEKELAKELNVTKSTISRYENGEMEIPASVLPLICEICSFSMHDYAKAFDGEETQTELVNQCSLCSLRLVKK